MFILPIDHEIWGQVPVVVIQGEADRKVRIPEFLLWAKDRLPDYQRPKWGFHFPDEWVHAGIKTSRIDLIKWVEMQTI